MAIKLRRNADPLGLEARTDRVRHPGGLSPVEPIAARCQAQDVLEHELHRYCDGLLRGRSFLIAGHRGAGKTSMVDSTLLRLQKLALNQQLRCKPLPVYVQAPLLFNGHDGELEQRLLEYVGLGLHHALAKEFVQRFHLHARQQQELNTRPPGELADLHELAARFQIELHEVPEPARLQQFWQRAGVAQDGLLFNPGHLRGAEQGLREMVALNGVSHVYQRISGKLEEKNDRSSGQRRSTESQTGVDAHWAELVKPVGALLAGGAVGGASASAGSTAGALILGLLAALGASLVFKMNTTVTRHRERKIDRTYLPDLSPKTLHRVMPELFERLLEAGLAPVFVVDELDKVDDLYERIRHLLDGMKKLFAERTFTCLLVDRGFYEQLHWREEEERRS